jgi:hypothetical protein
VLEEERHYSRQFYPDICLKIGGKDMQNSKTMHKKGFCELDIEFEVPKIDEKKAQST